MDGQLNCFCENPPALGFRNYQTQEYKTINKTNPFKYLILCIYSLLNVGCSSIHLYRGEDELYKTNILKLSHKK